MAAPAASLPTPVDGYAPLSIDDLYSESLLPRLRGYFTGGWPVTVEAHPTKGRFCTATETIALGRVVYAAASYAKGVHDSYRKRVCDVCLQYNDAGRYELSCARCHSVWYCSVACQARGQDQPPAPSSTGDDSLPLPPLPPSELHALDCGLLKKLSSCKLDKSRIGVIRLLFRLYRKVHAERQAALLAAATEQAATSADHLSASLAAATLHGSTGDSDLPPVITPTYRDISLLVGHAPPPATSTSAAASSRQVAWSELRRYLAKILPSSPSDSEYVDLDQLMHMCSQVESNGFGFFADKSARKGKDAAADDAEAAVAPSAPDHADATASNLHPPTASAASAAPSPSTAAISESASADSASISSSSSIPPKYIGVLLYPLASYFNHSCSANVRVTQLANSQLSMIASRDIALGEELTIEYIDCNKPVHTRGSELRDLYHFDCDCLRCARELSLESATGSSSAVKEKVSYATPASRAKSGAKKGLPPKRKKLEAKLQPPQQSDPLE